ncbi:hypothetical protein [Agarilytica rhodophyticola]|uniref:hypothetical protein n=1 Tax=Agarilytica rhodophyticola TaxID=1737490 RepID=UPI00131586E5|nr:hypothetical protein [Agarilytica rhodophyticola]
MINFVFSILLLLLATCLRAESVCLVNESSKVDGNIHYTFLGDGFIRIDVRFKKNQENDNFFKEAELFYGVPLKIDNYELLDDSKFILQTKLILLEEETMLSSTFTVSELFSPFSILMTLGSQSSSGICDKKFVRTVSNDDIDSSKTFGKISLRK